MVCEFHRRPDLTCGPSSQDSEQECPICREQFKEDPQVGDAGRVCNVCASEGPDSSAGSSSRRTPRWEPSSCMLGHRDPDSRNTHNLPQPLVSAALLSPTGRGHTPHLPLHAHLSTCPPHAQVLLSCTHVFHRACLASYERYVCVLSAGPAHPPIMGLPCKLYNSMGGTHVLCWA